MVIRKKVSTAMPPVLFLQYRHIQENKEERAAWAIYQIRKLSDWCTPTFIFMMFKINDHALLLFFSFFLLVFLLLFKLLFSFLLSLFFYYIYSSNILCMLWVTTHIYAFKTLLYWLCSFTTNAIDLKLLVL